MAPQKMWREKKSYRVAVVQSLRNVRRASLVLLRCSRASDEWMRLAIIVVRSPKAPVMGKCIRSRDLAWFYVCSLRIRWRTETFPSQVVSPTEMYSPSLSSSLPFVRLNRDCGDSGKMILRVAVRFLTTRSASSFPSSFLRIGRPLSTRLPFCAARGDNDDDRSIYRLLRIFLRIRAFQRLARPSADLIWRLHVRDRLQSRPILLTFTNTSSFLRSDFYVCEIESETFYKARFFQFYLRELQSYLINHAEQLHL